MALITGGAQGLGLAFSEILLENGAKVSFCDINDVTGQETLRNLQSKYDVSNVMFQRCNVTDQSEMEDFFKRTKERFGALDIVINNAGIGGERTNWERTIDVNLKGMISGSFLGLNYLRTDKGGNGGVIVNISSAAGLTQNPMSPVYCASKSGILVFSKSLACDEEIKNAGVRINICCPAFVDTALVRDLALDDSPAGSRTKALIEKVGVMTPMEVAEGVLELITDTSKNGTILKMSKCNGKEYVTLEYKTLKM